MVNSVSQTQQPPKNTVKTSIFYVNDVHSNLINLERLKTASDAFDSFEPSEQTDKLKLSAGDISVGRDKNFSKLGVIFENITNIMASAVGNHEFDLNKKDVIEVLNDNKYKLLGINVEIPETNEENIAIKNEITKSYIQEKNGTKYGIIGVLPFNFKFHLSDAQIYDDFNILQLNETIPLIQAEVDKFKEQGVNKVILLSHAGYQGDVEIAKQIEGIDVIIGGHTHDLIKGVKEGKNLFYSEKTGAPTVITQAGRNGDYFGVLNLEFDENGVIKSVQNNVTNSSEFSRSNIMKYFIDKALGAPEVVGNIKYAPKHTHTLIDENPGVNFLADAEREELGTDIAIINAGNIRASIEAGPITNRDLQLITPFDNKVWLIQVNEKDLVDAIQSGAESLIKDGNKPGILQFSGIKYTITKQGKLKEVYFVDKNGTEKLINVEHPDSSKLYTMAADDFIAKGGNDYFDPKNVIIKEKFNFDKNKVIADYIKKQSTPIEIRDEKRIKIID